MQILVDADALPNMIKEILFRAANRVQIQLIMVANQTVRIPKSEYISFQVVSEGLNEADHYIVEITNPGDLVITADIPLADRAIDKGGFALNPRGQFYTKNNIKQKLSIRNFMDNLRGAGVNTGGPAPFSQKDKQAFAHQLNMFLTKHLK